VIAGGGAYRARVHRTAGLILIVLLAACDGDGDDPAGSSPDATTTATIDSRQIPGDCPPWTGTPAPPGGWPVSSRCAGPTSGGCDAVEAETWDRRGVASLTTDQNTNLTELRGPDGAVIATLVGDHWFAPWGLTALPAGGWVLAGAGLGPGALAIGDATVELPFTYNRVIVHLVDGVPGWSQVLEGASGERLLVAARTDGSVVVAAEQMIDTMIDTPNGTITLAGPIWVYDFFLAALTPDGAWSWAIELPSPASPVGDFAVETLSLGPESEAIAHGALRGTLELGTDTVVGPVAARAVASELGDWLDLAAEL
jgi:hypothetical protein